MHDVGKIGIPDQIIQKKGKLTTDEFTTIKGHSLIGYKLLHDADNELLAKAALVARDHHEYWNGNGYPYGKKGKDISLEGRIVAIADVFDALTSRRSYKEPWSFDESLAYLQKQRGDQFDAELVELFCQRESTVEAIYQHYRED